MTLHRFPSRRATCPVCGKKVTSYVPTAHSEALDGPRVYIFRSHLNDEIPWNKKACEGWARRVPDDAFEDGKPNIDV